MFSCRTCAAQARTRARCRARRRRGSRRGCPRSPCRLRRGTYRGLPRPGARSRKSRNVERPSAKRISMNPPPPRLPALGSVTARAKPTATAASTALPPLRRISTPAAVACGSAVTTIAFRAWTGVNVPARAPRQANAATARSAYGRGNGAGAFPPRRLRVPSFCSCSDSCALAALRGFRSPPGNAYAGKDRALRNFEHKFTGYGNILERFAL